MTKKIIKTIAEMAVMSLFVGAFCWMVYQGFGTPGMSM